MAGDPSRNLRSGGVNDAAVVLTATVGQLARYIAARLDGDERLRDLWIEGEASNCSHASSGHWYWTLKEDDHQLTCVMWRTQAALQQTLPVDGSHLTCHGEVRAYTGRSQYQLVVDSVQPAGTGVLHLELERLKRALSAEGLFDESLKRPLPQVPSRIGLVTSAEGSALRDVRTTLERRWPLATLVLTATVVQGAAAAAGVAEALRRVSRAGVDVIILARGGGSLEDLAAFNSEAVVRAIRASSVPVVTGVGHETDTTLADLAADLRAATPTAAAERCSPDLDQYRQRVDMLRLAADQSVARRLVRFAEKLGHLRLALAAASPWNRLERRGDGIFAARARLNRAIVSQLQNRGRDVEALRQRLRGLGPDATLSRGYAHVRRAADGVTVMDPNQAPQGTELDVRVARGQFGAKSFEGSVQATVPAAPWSTV